MNLSIFGGIIKAGIKEHAPLILSVLAGAGTVVTAYLAAKAGYEAAQYIRLADDHKRIIDKKERFKENGKLVWKLYIPTAISATSTISCIAFANRIGTKKTLAAQAAVAVAQRAYSEYRDKVIEELGESKDRSIRDKIAEDRVKELPPPSQEVLVTGPGNVLCCELFTGRYFTSDMETLRRSQNDINAKLLAHDYATLDDFYYMVGLSRTSYSSQNGWKSTKQMNLEFSTVLTDDGRPCLAFEYNYTTLL